MDLIKINVENESKKVIEYLLNKQAHNLGFIRYSQFKKMIVYITKIKSLYQIRKIFLYLVETKIFIKKKTEKKSYLYKFYNPHEAKIEQRSITITFD